MESIKNRKASISKASLLQAFIYKNPHDLPSLFDLSFELGNNPQVAKILGFDPWKKPPLV